MIQQMLTIWSLVPLPFLNPAWTSGSSWFMYCWSLAWRILSITLLACEMSAIVQQLEHSLALPFFGIGVKIELFQSCGHCWDFQICWHIECSTFTASSFRIWNSSTAIPSPPLALFVVMLPKAHLTSHSRISGSSLMMTPHDYLGHEDLFCIVLCILLCLRLGQYQLASLSGFCGFFLVFMSLALFSGQVCSTWHVSVISKVLKPSFTFYHFPLNLILKN